MKNIGIALLLAAVASTPALPQNSKHPFLGRWDLTVTVGDAKYASWLEVTEKAGKPAKFDPWRVNQDAVYIEAGTAGEEKLIQSGRRSVPRAVARA